MRRYRVSMAPRAQGEYRRAVACGRANRRENPKLIVAEMKEAGARLIVAPEAGMLADDVEPGVRKRPAPEDAVLRVLRGRPRGPHSVNPVYMAHHPRRAAAAVVDPS